MRTAIVLFCLTASWLTGESWHGTYSLSDHDYGSAVAFAPDGGIVLGVMSGNYYDSEQSTVLLKIDPAGSIVWQRRWGIWGTMGLAVGSDGTIWVAQGVEGTRDIYLLHLDRNGDSLGSRRIRSHSADEFGYGGRLKAIPDGWMLMGADWVIRLNADGWPVWARGYSSLIGLIDIAVGSDGNYWLAGAEEGWNAALLGVSAADGSVLAAYRYPRHTEQWSSVDSSFLSVRHFPDGTLMAVAKSDVGHHLSDSWVVRLDGDGSVLSQQIAGFSATAAAIHADGYAVIGYSSSSPYWAGVPQAIVAVSPEAGALWSAEYIHGWEYSYFWGLAMDPLGRIAFAGSGSLMMEPGQDEPVVVATAGILETDGTVPGCGFLSVRTEDSDSLSLGRESFEVASEILPLDIQGVDIRVVDAQGTVDYCHASGNHRRPLGRP
jgi:hypothetical protein